MIPLTLFAAVVALYFTIGIAAWRVAERRDIKGDTRMLIYGWLPVGMIVAAMDDSAHAEECDEVQL